MIEEKQNIDMNEEEEKKEDIEVQKVFSEWWANERQRMIVITKSGYKFDKGIFQIGLVIIFLYLYLAAASMNFNWYYLTCNPRLHEEITPLEEKIPEGYCLNPVYKPATWINEKYLTAGTYGTKPGFFYHSAFYAVPLIGLLCLLVNHSIYNKKKVK